MIDLEDVPAARPLSPARRAADVALLSSAAQAPAPVRRMSRRVLTVGVVVAVPVVIAATAAAMDLLPPRSASVQDSGRCYSSVSTDFGADFPGTTVANAATGQSPAPDVPPLVVEDCAAAWRAGILRLGDPHVGGSPVGTYPVPALIACVLPSGQAAVFPGPASTCSTLGLAPLLPG